MTDLKDHAQKIERIVQALTAEGIGRDVAVSTALMRYPPTRTLGVDAELAAIKTKDYCLVGEALHTYAQAPALDPAYARALERDAAIDQRDFLIKLSGETRAALFTALDREDSTLTTPQMVASLAGERDTLIDREVQMRAACIDAIGPVSSGSTLDLVHKLASELKVARAEIADYARLREHNLQLQALVSKVRAAVS